METKNTEIIEKVNQVLQKVDKFFHGLEPSLQHAISRDKYFEQHPEITDHKNFNFSLSGDDIEEKKIPYNVAGCTGRAKLFSKYAREIGLKDFNIVATVKQKDLNNKNSDKMIDGHQVIAIKLSDGLHMIDPGAGKTYEKAKIEGDCKVGENIDAVRNDKKEYVISAILTPAEYDEVKTYEQIKQLYLRVKNKNMQDKYKLAIENIKNLDQEAQNQQLQQAVYVNMIKTTALDTN